MKTFGEIKKGDEVYRLVDGKVGILQIKNIVEIDSKTVTISFYVASPPVMANKVYALLSCDTGEYFADKDRLIAYLDNKVFMLRNKANHLDKLKTRLIHR